MCNNKSLKTKNDTDWNLAKQFFLINYKLIIVSIINYKINYINILDFFLSFMVNFYYYKMYGENKENKKNRPFDTQNRQFYIGTLEIENL